VSTTTQDEITTPDFAVVEVNPNAAPCGVPLSATCTRCAGIVVREAHWTGAQLVLEPWRHAGGAGESDHLVTEIFLGIS